VRPPVFRNIASPSTVNLYTYTGDDPTNTTDPTGHGISPGAKPYTGPMHDYAKCFEGLGFGGASVAAVLISGGEAVVILVGTGGAGGSLTLAIESC